MIDGVSRFKHAECCDTVFDYLMESYFESVIQVTEVVAPLADWRAEIVFGSGQQAFG